MARMTIAIDTQVLRAARAKAARQGTSVNEICRQAIERFVYGAGDVEARLDRLNVLAKTARRSGAGLSAEPLWPGRATLYAGAPRP